MITVVTAPGRSGTSLTMQMLQAAGIPLMWNRLPNRTEINPFGHYELNQYHWTPEYARDILPQCEGKAVKIFRKNLQYLTDDHDYQFITIYRDPVCVRDSQIVMLEKENRQREIQDNAGHLANVEACHAWMSKWLKGKRHLRLTFAQLFDGTGPQAIADWLTIDGYAPVWSREQRPIAVLKMKDCVSPSLWHFKPNSLSTGVNV